MAPAEMGGVNSGLFLITLKNALAIGAAFYTDAVLARRSGGGSGYSTGVFVPSDTDL